MLPDINIKDYYNQFIYKAKADIIDYRNKINQYTEVKDNIAKYLEDNKEILKESFNINYNNITKEVYDRSIKIANENFEHKDRIVLLQVIKYYNVVLCINKNNKLIELANKRKNLKFNDYRKYITLYYNQVHKCVLEGLGYKFGFGIGTYVINYWKINRKSKKIYLDYYETNKRKKELLAKGVKLYDDKEAAWYKARHIPYDGVEYKVFKEINHFYDICFIKSTICKGNSLDYKHTEYIANKYRGMSYTKLADEFCDTFADIYNLQVDIKYKLNILLYKDPSKYLNFVRNADQCKYNNREDYS